MFKNKQKSQSLSQKQIPTIVGLLILVGALVAGVLFLGEGTTVFAPRATPEMAPKNVRITNLKHDSFTVTFYTEEETSGYIKYGLEANKMNSQIRDDRDQLSGSVDNFKLHHITVRGLEPATNYYFVLGTGSKSEFDQEGQPFQVTTSVTPSSPLPEAITVFGSVALESGAPAQGSIIFITSPEIQDQSSLVKGSGSWAIPISQAMNAEGNNYAHLADEDEIQILVQGLASEQRVQTRVKIKDSQPIELVFGQEASIKEEPIVQEIVTNEDSSVEFEDESTVTQLPNKNEVTNAEESDVSGHLKELLKEEPLLPVSSASSELLMGELKVDPDEQVYTNAAPVIKGIAAPDVEVKIQVHSENQYVSTVTADGQGEFELDLTKLQAELEPGEHTVTYSYIDPDTGLEVVKTEFFWVEDPNKVTLAMADTQSTTSTIASTNETTPYGTGDPYPMPSPTGLPDALPTVSLSPTITTTVPPATSATEATREHIVGTGSGAYRAGSIGATMLLVLSGVFFILIGAWSWWLAGEIEE